MGRNTMKIILTVLLLSTFSVIAKEPNMGKKYPTNIIRVIDGDTLKIEAKWLPDPLPKQISVRLNNIDTPEKGARSQCESEQILSAKATEFTKTKVKESKKQEVIIYKFEKYGRLLADIVLDNKNLSKMLIDSKLARPYYGGTKQSWCEVK
jgi:micrococcal nuclease